MSIKCQFHQSTEIFPTMIHFGTSPLGNRQYVCARCARIREMGNGTITYLYHKYGFINNGKRDIYFDFKNLNSFKPKRGMTVKYEIAFKDDDIEAINIEKKISANQPDFNQIKHYQSFNV